jgi:putative DNA-binding protein
MSLAALQRDFSSWLTVEASDAAARFGDRAAPGLAVYLNNYRGQLMTCLAQSFGAVRAWLGDTAFDGAAATHIDRRPPHSWTLDAYAIDFPDTLDTLYPQDPEVAELACLERDLGLAFVARDAAQLTLPDMAHVDWSSAILELVPSFSLLPVTTNAGAIWAAIESEQTPPAAATLDVPAVIAVWRKDYSPTFRTLDPVEAGAMFMLTDGRTFGEICAAIVHEVGEVDGPQVAGNLLGRWIAEGMIGSIRSDSVSPPVAGIAQIKVLARHATSTGPQWATAARQPATDEAPTIPANP